MIIKTALNASGTAWNKETVKPNGYTDLTESHVNCVENT
jgi:hypothetical protein